MYNALPIWQRHFLAFWIKGKSELEFNKYITQRWDGDKFNRNPDELYDLAEFSRLPDGFNGSIKALAKRLVNLRQKYPF